MIMEAKEIILTNVAGFTKVESNVFNLIYIEKKNITEISYIIGFSQAQTYRIKKKVIAKLRDKKIDLIKV